MIKRIIYIFVIALLLSSCVRYKVESSSQSGCGVWYPAGKFNK